ncbi:MBL fold metallo-hydrolase [Lysinibacillus telephonicus]|uniref:MBL fold metallo-hydrolase n=1 Tax=Lysinibacillus telephonicus TaxID=1714840 RepID=A0A3S0JU88_9BACI|nr:MBL fold metallo-hydrolase [Lysinibacillus telephonicus]RTQ96067.1 MBL fold metallo-hydrolase [Lysinibacillus telephonicus]
MIQFQNEQITVFQSELYKTTSSVIQTEDVLLIVDPNLLPNEVKEIQEHVNKVKGNRPIYLLFTHSDWDHFIGYGAFLGATVIASKIFKDRDNKEELLNQIKQFDDQYYIDRDYPILFPPVDITVNNDGQVLKIGKTTLTFYKAEGHTNDSIYTIIEPLGIWVAGDYLSDLEIPFIYFSSEKYEETLRKTDIILSKHKINMLIPGHGHIAETSKEIIIRNDKSLQYIQELRKSIKNYWDCRHLLKDYKYKNGQFEDHNGNISLIKKELNIE